MEEPTSSSLTLLFYVATMTADPHLFFYTLFLLVFVHCVGDFGIQTDYLAKGKDPMNNPPTIWIPCMFAHCMIHAGLVLLLTAEMKLAIIMFLMHFIIDSLKCLKSFGEGGEAFCYDQLCHFAVILAIASTYCNY